MAVTSGETNGWRMVSEHGNVFGNKRWEIYNLPAGTYEWTVQAIDANFMVAHLPKQKHSQLPLLV